MHLIQPIQTFSILQSDGCPFTKTFWFGFPWMNFLELGEIKPFAGSNWMVLLEQSPVKMPSMKIHGSNHGMASLVGLMVSSGFNLSQSLRFSPSPLVFGG